MIKAVLFDLDGTLLDRDASLQQFVASQHRRFAAALAHIPAPIYIARFLALDRHGHVGKDRVYQQLVAEFTITGITWQALERDYVLQFHHCCLPFPGMMEMLEVLQVRGYRLGIITNGMSDFQERTLACLGIASLFTVAPISEREGVRKPEPEIFHRALRQMGVRPHESVFVGDHPEVDVAGAQRAGMQAIWKHTPHWSAPATCSAVITHLMEIPTIIQQLGAATP